MSILDRHIKEINCDWLSDEVIDAYLSSIQKESKVSFLFNPCANVGHA